MSNMIFDSLESMKDAIVKAKDGALESATAALDANHDGTIDIQDVIVLAVKTPGVYQP